MKWTTKLFGAIAVATFACSCGPASPKAASPASSEDARTMNSLKEIAARGLLDPGSAEFRDVYLGPHGALCGEINSKNEYGAYSGFRAFVVITDRTGGPKGFISSDRHNKEELEMCHYWISEAKKVRGTPGAKVYIDEYARSCRDIDVAFWAGMNWECPRSAPNYPDGK